MVGIGCRQYKASPRLQEVPDIAQEMQWILSVLDYVKSDKNIICLSDASVQQIDIALSDARSNVFVCHGYGMRRQFNAIGIKSILKGDLDKKTA